MKNPKGGVPNVKLRDFRKQRMLTQADVARELGVTDLTVGRWERGEAVPSAYYVKKLCDFFETSPQALGLVPLSEAVDAGDGGAANEGREITPIQESQKEEKSTIIDEEQKEREKRFASQELERRSVVDVGMLPVPESRSKSGRVMSGGVALMASGGIMMLCVLLISLLVIPRLFPGGSGSNAMTSDAKMTTKVPTPTPTTLIDGEVHLSFEDGDASYFNDVRKTLQPFSASTKYAYEGKKSAEFTYNNDVESTWPDAFIGDSQIDRLGIQPPMKNQTLFAYIYLPADSSLSLVCKLVVIGKNSSWHEEEPPLELANGNWTRLTMKVPEDHPDQIGFQCGGVGHGALYLDAIGW